MFYKGNSVFKNTGSLDRMLLIPIVLGRINREFSKKIFKEYLIQPVFMNPYKQTDLAQ